MKDFLIPFLKIYANKQTKNHELSTSKNKNKKIQPPTIITRTFNLQVL
jgi:hypothetical protein